MDVVAWILLVCFGMIGLSLLNRFFRTTINLKECYLMLFSVIVAALSAGVIWGGLRFGL